MGVLGYGDIEVSMMDSFFFLSFLATINISGAGLRCEDIPSSRVPAPRSYAGTSHSLEWNSVVH